MPLVRNPKTGLVSITSVDPDDNSGLSDPKYGKIRRAYTKFADEEDRENPCHDTTQGPLKTPPSLHLGLEDQLLVEDTVGDSSVMAECANSRHWPRMWVQFILDDELDAMVDPEWPFLNRLGHFCLEAQIRRCKREKCRQNRELMGHAVPRCKWDRFRDWALTLISCQASCTPEQMLLRPHFHLSAAAKTCHWLLYQYKDERREMTNVLLDKDGTEQIGDPFGVCEIIYWMQIVQHHLTGIGGILESRLGPEFLQPSITAPAVEEATRKAHEIGLCRNRLWNLSILSERKYVDLPALVETAAEHPQLRHEGHDECTVELCRFNYLDSTTVKQLHKCEDGLNCKPKLEFDQTLLSKSLKEKGRTDWTISFPFEVPNDRKTKYMAVSHVWSDGTGIGLQDSGKVNSCLFKYMASIAKTVGCEAIWWDTISIPTDETRRLAINRMHMNYSRAECTIVHDQYLLDFEWADDGSPCVALIFSPWFTRGWTALELIMSRTVKVLFKGPNHLEPVIKDLDQHILADDPSRCSRAHWIASTIIRRLRQKIRNTTDLMAVLKPRSTSKPRDRMIIAGLLTNFEFKDYKMSKEEITKVVIDRLFKINPSCLHHGQVTMTESGGWSWCPPSLYDMPVDTAADLFREGEVGDLTCLVDKHGRIAGCWQYRPLEERDVKEGRIVANSTQAPVILNIKAALRHWRYCMLLREEIGGPAHGTAILVMLVGEEENFLHCKFIGSVREFSPQPPSGYDERYKTYWFKIGYKGKPDLEAKSYVTADTPLDDPLWDYHWLPGRLWIGDKPFTGQILVARFEPRKRLAKGYYLEATANTSLAQGTTSETDSDRSIRVFLCNAKVGLSKKPVFRAENTFRSSGKDLTRIAAEDLWPPNTIPAKDRTHHKWEIYNSDRNNYSEDLFRLESLHSGPEVFAALDPMLHTPDTRHPYKGVWICMENPIPLHGVVMTLISKTDLSPSDGYEFLLFHQPSEARLEAIKLTGDRKVPRGAHYFIVENLKIVKREFTAQKWLGSPVVTAKVQIAEDGFVNRKFPTLSLCILLRRKSG